MREFNIVHLEKVWQVLSKKRSEKNRDLHVYCRKWLQIYASAQLSEFPYIVW